MRNVMTLAVLVGALGLFGSNVAQADVIHVPEDQPTIQAGIDAAIDGDEVVVAPDTYGDIDLADFADFEFCLSDPPGFEFPCFMKFDFDGNDGIDIDDYAAFHSSMLGP